MEKSILGRSLTDAEAVIVKAHGLWGEEVIDYFDRGGQSNPWISPEIKPLGLTAPGKKDLAAFLLALNGDKALIAEPTRLPQ